ncbi:4Fe-4S binding protein [Clostridium beijerinckii]|uniref:4Fe-4S binding protein n=1 Tax=Clostridium beijerinckii TaxID=1520 RepID=UPI0009C19BF2
MIKARRGHLEVDIDKCTYCGNCQNKCPAKAIIVCASRKVWHVDNEKCIRCSRCLRKCPSLALSMVKKLKEYK